MNWEKTNYKRQSYTLTDYYLFYKGNIEKNTVYDIDMKTYKAIITDYLKYIRDQIMQECKEFKLPCRLGTLSIIKHRPKEFSNRSLRFDWKATKETGKAVYLLNEHSNYLSIDSIGVRNTVYLLIRQDISLWLLERIREIQLR